MWTNLKIKSIIDLYFLACQFSVVIYQYLTDTHACKCASLPANKTGWVVDVKDVVISGYSLQGLSPSFLGELFIFEEYLQIDYRFL